MKLIKELSDGVLDGDFVGSTEISFVPGDMKGGEFSVDTKTAGSISLMIQAVLPCLLFSKKATKIVMKGGTNVDFSPPIDYLLKVFRPTAKHFGIQFDCELIRRGFYPKGGGEVYLSASPLRILTSVVLDKPQSIKQIEGVSFVSGTIPTHVAQTMCESATNKIGKSSGKIPIHINTLKENSQHSFGNGAAIMLIGETTDGFFVGGSALGNPRTPAAKVGETAATELIDSISQCVGIDQYLQDQIIIFMALSEGTSRVLVGPLTLHTKTAIHITTMLTKVQFNVIDMNSQPETYLLECTGIGFVNKYL